MRRRHEPPGNTKLPSVESVVDDLSKGLEESLRTAVEKREEILKSPSTQVELPQSKEPAKPANAPKTVHDLYIGRGMDRIVTSVFKIPDTEEEFEELRKALKFEERPSAMGYGELIDALDKSGNYAMRAAELVAVAKLALNEFEIHAKIIEGAIREKAHEELIALKETGKYAGRFSAEDVNGMMAKLRADEYLELERKRVEAKQTIEVLEALAANWVERQRNIRAMVASGKGAG